jgi:hypothetical protein
MRRMQGFPVLLISLTITAVSPVSAQSAGGKKPASHVCFMDGCFDEYIVSLKRASSGLVTVQTRLESHCYPGSNCTAISNIMVNAHRNPNSIHHTRPRHISSFGPPPVQAWLCVETERRLLNH